MNNANRNETWHDWSLSDLFSIKHGYAFDGKYFTTSGQYVLLTPGNFYDAGGFKYKDQEKFFVGEVDVEYILNRGDLLVAMTEQAEGLLGSSALIPESGKYLHNQRLGLVTGLKEDRVDKRFLCYLFNSRQVRTQIRASATGTKVRHTSPSRIGEVKVRIPGVTTQRKVATVVSAYDDLIKNNTRRIAILEEMVQALYREWFVCFRFPNHDNVPLVPSPLGDIPQGWKPTRFGDLAAEVRRGVSPSEIDPETPYIGLEHLPRKSITLENWGRAGDVQSTKLRFKKGEILFGKIRPYFHKVGVAPVDGVASSDAIVIVPKKSEYFAPALCCASSDDFVSHATQTSQGTKMPRANWDVLVKYRLPLPPEPLLGQFNALIGDSVRMLHNLMSKNRNLRNIRDLLLPKLISGQIDVEHLDIDIGAGLVEVNA